MSFKSKNAAQHRKDKSAAKEGANLMTPEEQAKTVAVARANKEIPLDQLLELSRETQSEQKG